MTVSNFDELIKVSHEMAVEKGWWPEGEKRPDTEVFANFHAELSEAWEEYRRGRMFPWHVSIDAASQDRVVYTYENVDSFPAGPKPEGFSVELADFLIRLADWCGSLGITSLKERDKEIGPDYKVKADEVVMFLHITTSRLFSLADGLVSADALADGLLSIFSNDISDKAREIIEKRKQELLEISVSRAVHVCLNQVESFMGNENLWKVVNLKLAFNANRSFRHGGMKA